MDYILTKTERELSERKLEAYSKYAEIITWGRKYPVRFCERFFGIEFLDHQKYVYMNSWITPRNVWCQSRGSGKTTLVAPFVMGKGVLIPRFQTYIMSDVGSQSQECFLKIEKIAKKEISSFTGLTDFFMGEIESGRSDKDGFVHGASSFNYKLFNDSRTNSLNGAFDHNRSKRSNLNIYDEAGFAQEEMFTTSMPFITQDSNFQLGGSVKVELRPRQFPNQAIFASSASDMGTYFYQNAYKEYAKKMMMGDPNYFVADINCDVIFNATYNGKLYPVSLLKKEDVEDEMSKNKDKALREFYNKFTVDGGDQQPFKRSMFIRNSESRLPEYTSNGNRVLFAYDPARTTDNSFVLIAVLYEDEKVGLKARIINGRNFLDPKTKNKTPMRSPDQRLELKRMILQYNGDDAADYEYLEKLLMDSGAGGGGRLIGDEFMEDWLDPRDGVTKHRGLLDFEEHKEYRDRFPNALNKQMLINPRKNKVLMFDALEEMLSQDLISFPQYDGKDYITLFKEGDEITVIDDDGNSHTEKERIAYEYKLSDEEMVSLRQIELVKEETINMYRYEEGKSVRYDLAPDKRNTNDDRAYCLAMIAWYLQKLRSGKIVERKPQKNYETAEVFTSVIDF